MNLIRLVSMREIKFRGKSIKIDCFGKWVYGDLHIRSPFAHIHEDIGKRAPIDPDTIGQFTGLTDKNGIEIYENDVIKVDCFIGEPSYIVKWDVIGARFIFVSTESGGYLTPRDFNFEYVEVIGNTIDNPELLTNKI